MTDPATAAHTSPALPLTERRALLAGVAGLAAGALLSRSAHAGPLTPPPGPIGSTGKTLTEVEPRTAINTTNTPGTAICTFRISQPGSYYLTGNISGEPAKIGIEITADNVSIDLMGFTLAGVPGSNDAIATAGMRNNIAVRNGTIRSWGDSGINLILGGGGTGAVIERVTVFGCAGAGIRAGQSSIINSCTAFGNGSLGIETSGGAVISGCIASSNGATGILTGSASVVENCRSDTNPFGILVDAGSSVSSCTAQACTVMGIIAGNGCTLTGCTAHAITGIGIACGAFNTVTACTASDNQGFGITAGESTLIAESTIKGNSGGAGLTAGNGTAITRCVVAHNAGHGISIESSGSVRDNTCHNNGTGASGTAGAAINATGTRNRIEGNHCVANGRGLIITGTQNIIARNTCSANTLNWSIVANNIVGPIGIAPPSAAISGNTGGVGLGTTDPHANFTA